MPTDAEEKIGQLQRDVEMEINCILSCLEEMEPTDSAILYLQKLQSILCRTSASVFKGIEALTEARIDLERKIAQLK